MKVYTYNDKVLTNSANGKWLKEKEAPAGLEFKLANAIHIDTTNNIAIWESPTYPDVGADFTGKNCIFVLSDAVHLGEVNVVYVDSATATSSGPVIAVSKCGSTQAAGYIAVPGTYTEQCTSNPAPVYFGKYIAVILRGTDTGAFNDVMSKLTITIVDP